MTVRLRQGKRLIKVWKKVLEKFLGILGVVSIVIGFVGYFYEIPKFNWIYIFIAIIFLLIISIIICRPKISYDYQLNNKEIKIRIKIGDITKADNIVVPINNQFKITSCIKNTKKSVLNSVINKCFNRDFEHLEKKLHEISKGNVYPIGKVISIKCDNGKNFYFLANTKLDKNQRSCSTETDLYDSIKGLFDYGNIDTCDELAIPILNSGHGNINGLNRWDIILNIIEIFITMSQERVICKNLAIYIYPDDVENFKIDIDELNTYVRLSIKYWRDKKGNNKVNGESVNVSEDKFNELYEIFEKNLHEI